MVYAKIMEPVSSYCWQVLKINCSNEIEIFNLSLFEDHVQLSKVNRIHLSIFFDRNLIFVIVQRSILKMIFE